MKLEFYNCPKPEDIDSSRLNRDGNDKQGLPEAPEFIKYQPDFELLKELADKYQRYQNILVIGHGGSITSFYGFYQTLKYQAKKIVYFLNTVDPDYIFELKQQLKPEDTLVIAISKSGENVTQIEALMPFADFPLLIITGKSSPLRAIGEKLKAKIITHPPIGGRYTGLTEVALIPAAIAGLDAEKLYEGAKAFYRLYEKDNLAWRAASVLYQLELKGFVDVFMPFYSHNLFALSNLIVQLCHESFGKNGKGQTYFAHEAPESQHHTNQRFFGGTKNICGFFLGSESFTHPLQNIFPPATHSAQIKGHPLFDLNKIPLEKAMEFELLGTLEDAKIHGIPAAHLSILGFDPKEIGSFVAFWQLYAVYASVLRNVDPFDQPQVESSKNISFHKRLEFKGLL
jgi:glucose-6-phosphate isomerase